jgi:hypothetical protein
VLKTCTIGDNLERHTSLQVRDKHLQAISLHDNNVPVHYAPMRADLHTLPVRLMSSTSPCFRPAGSSSCISGAATAEHVCLCKVLWRLAGLVRKCWYLWKLAHFIIFCQEFQQHAEGYKKPPRTAMLRSALVSPPCTMCFPRALVDSAHKSI